MKRWATVRLSLVAITAGLFAVGGSAGTALASAPAVSCIASGSAVVAVVVGGTSSDYLWIFAYGNQYSFQWDGQNVCVGSGYTPTTNPVVEVAETASSVPVTFFDINQNALTFEGAPNVANTLDLSQTSGTGMVVLTDSASGASGTATVGGGTSYFSNITVFNGSPSGTDQFDVSGSGAALSLLGVSHTTVNLSGVAASAANPLNVTIPSTGTPTVSGSDFSATMTGVQSVRGSLSGYTNFTLGSASGLTLLGQGTQNTLSFQKDTTSGVSVNAQTGTATVGSGTDSFSDISGFTGSPGNDTFFGGSGVSVDGGGGSDTLSYGSAPNAITLSFSGGQAKITGGYPGNTSVATNVNAFVGSSAGGNVFTPRGDAGGYSFSSGGSGNILSLVNLAPLNTVSGGQITGFVDGTSDTYSGMQPAQAPVFTAGVVEEAGSTNPWTGTELAGSAAQDALALTGIVSGTAPTGSATYDFFHNGDCSGQPATTQTVTLSGGAVPTSASTGALGGGTYSYSAAYSGDGVYNPESSGCQSFSVISTQAISINQPSSPFFTYGTAPLQLAAAGGGSGSPVIFSVDPSSSTVCSTSGTDGATLTILAVGACKIDANQAGGSGYAAAPQQTKTLTIHPAALVISASNLQASHGRLLPQLTWSADFVNGDTASSLATQPTCTSTVLTDPNGVILSPAGSYPITCSGAADVNYTISYKAGALTVGLEPTAISNLAPKTAKHGGTAVMKALLTTDTHYPVSGRALSFTLTEGKTTQTCSAVTNSAGVASCKLTKLKANKGKATLRVNFASDAAGANAFFATSQAEAPVTIK